MTYGLLFWGNSSHSIEIFRLHRKIIRIMMGARIKDSGREFFKILGKLTLMAEHIYSVTVFVVNNRQYFSDSSKLYDTKTRKNKNLLQPQSNLSVYQRGPLQAGIKVYRVSQEEQTKLREGVPYVKPYRYNPKHLYPKLNGYGDNGHRKVWASVVSTYCKPSVTSYSSTAQAQEQETTS